MNIQGRSVRARAQCTVKHRIIGYICSFISCKLDYYGTAQNPGTVQTSCGSDANVHFIWTRLEDRIEA